MIDWYRKILWILIIFIGGIIYFLHHNIVYDGNLNIFSKSYTWIVKNNYIYFYIKKSEDPTYIFKSDIFEQYAKNCHKEWKNCIIFPFQKIYADILWLWAIQYLGSVIDVARAPYMYNMLNNLSNLAPYWDYPYYFWELMLPLSQAMHYKLWEDRLKKSWIESVKYWEKGKYFNCDEEKIKWILSLSDKGFFETVYLKSGFWLKYKNPCDIYEIPYQLGFNYWFYFQDAEKSSINYKIASFFDDVPKITPSMVIIVNWRKGEHEKSMQLAFLRYISLLKKLDYAKNEDDIKLLKSKINESLYSSIVQYIYSVLKRADNLVNADPSCYHDFDCLAKKGLVSYVISQDIKQCKNSWINFTKEQLNSIEKMDPNDSNFNILVKCYVISYWLQKGFINLKQYPYLFYKDVDWNEYDFKFDMTYWTWRIRPKE